MHKSIPKTINSWWFVFGGWSAYFVELDKEYQDHVIARQAYTV